MTRDHDDDDRPMRLLPPPTEPTWDPNDPWGTGPDTDTTTPDPTDEAHDTERAILSALLNAENHTTAAYNIIDKLNTAYFTSPTHIALFDAILGLRGHEQPLNHITIQTTLKTHNTLKAAGGHNYLSELIRLGYTPPTVAAAVTDLDTTFVRRSMYTLGDDVKLAARTTDRDELIARRDDAIARLMRVTLPLTPERATPTNTPIDDFLNNETAPYDWLVPGLLERGDRLIVTANEGMGKSTFCRQLAVQLAAGLHPFQHTWGTPHRVLFIDLENSDRQTQRNLKPLRVKVPTLNSDDLRVICRIEGLDLNDPTDVTWLDNEITDARPDVLITGPIYKMGSGDPNSEEVAKPVAMTIDKLRAKHRISVILEAHPNKTGVGTANRSKEPFGWSGWLRWPEFGIHIGDEGAITHWRGMREQREFPTTLKRGGPWPWTPADTPEDLEWYKIRDTMKAVGKHLSVREIERMTGIKKSTAARILQDYSTQHTALMAQLNLAPTDDPDDDEV